MLSTDIVLFPDHDKPDSKGITPFIKWSLLAEKLHDIGYDIKVSDTLEQENIPFGYDIADVFIDIEGVKVDRVDKVGLKPAPVLDRTLTKKRSTALDCVKVDRSVSFEKMDKKPIKPSTRLDNIQKTIDKSNQRYELERQKKLAQEQIRQRLDWVKDQIGEIDIPDHPVKVGILTYLDIPKAISVDIDIVERRMDDYAEAPLRRLEKLIDALTNQSFQVV